MWAISAHTTVHEPHQQSQTESNKTMTMTITTTWVVDAIDDLASIMRSLSDVAIVPTSTVLVGSIVESDPDYTNDQTPPFGTERPDVHEWNELADEPGQVAAREQYITALVMWTREHITEGPISEVSNADMRDVYRGFVMFGDDAERYNVTPTQLSCLRGAFRDATAGQVPL